MKILLPADVSCCRTGPKRDLGLCMETGRCWVKSDWSAGDRDVGESLETAREMRRTGARLVCTRTPMES